MGLWILLWNFWLQIFWFISQIFLIFATTLHFTQLAFRISHFRFHFGCQSFQLFIVENRMEKEELIERALRLARQAQETALKNPPSPHAKQVWSRPSSASKYVILYYHCFYI